MKKCAGYCLAFLLLSLVLAGLPVRTPAAEAKQDAQLKLSLNQEELALPTDDLTNRQGVTFIQLYQLMDILDGSVAWQPDTATVVAQWQGITMSFKNDADYCVQSGRKIKLGGRSFLLHNRLMVPLRSVCEQYGIKLDWDEQQWMINLQVPDFFQSKRLYNPSIPAQIAFLNHDHLFIMDGSKPGAEPVLVSQGGVNQIVGWSADGQWLAYLNTPLKNSYYGEQYLWVVKADGSGAMQIDHHPLANSYITNNPEWSPRENTLAYLIRESVGSYETLPGVYFASYRDGQWTHNHLDVTNSSARIFDLAWTPDGASLAVSVPATDTAGPRLERLALSGQSDCLLQIDQDRSPEGSANQAPGVSWGACSMKWSPDGRYLTYYLCPGSASMTADGTELFVLDTVSPSQTIDLGSSLAYGDWLAWSGDSTQLAYIKGYGRDVIVNKNLTVVDLRNQTVQIKDVSQSGQADVRPFWMPGSTALLFCRGTENKEMFNYNRPGVLVPGQRIWQKSATADKAAILSSGPDDSADYAPSVSPDGKMLVYLQLRDKNQGSICLQNLNGTTRCDKIVDVNGYFGGFYGNYLPDCYCIYWTD